jgi:pyruvate dehydrogenase E1 component alpha subunit
VKTCYWRKFEDKLAALYIQQKSRKSIYIMDKKVQHVMDLTKDRMITAQESRSTIGMGVDPKRVMAELLGKVTGTSKEWVVLHIFSKEHTYGGLGL